MIEVFWIPLYTGTPHAFCLLTTVITCVLVGHVARYRMVGFGMHLKQSEGGGVDTVERAAPFDVLAHFLAD